MENKTNIAELLKDCPSGMELDCTMWDNVLFDHIDTTSNYPIYIKKMGGELEYLTEDGHFNFDCDAKCVIFPKGKTTWEEFVPPCKFKDGDVAITYMGDIHLCRTEDSSYCACRMPYARLHRFDSTITTGVKFIRLATEKEKQILFDSIKANGYRWNPETKTLEKLPKFKIGDKIIKKNGLRVPFVITGVSDYYYWSNTENSVEVLPVAEQDDWELVPTKFDINTLKAFDKVLVRDNNEQFWTCDWFSFHDTKQVYPFACVGHYVSQCIPYEENQHLLGTTNDCIEYYKTW